MTGQTLRKTMFFLMMIGLSVTGVGLGLAILTDMISHGSTNDIMLITLLVAGGLLISVSAKIYLILQPMRMDDEQNHEEKAM